MPITEVIIKVGRSVAPKVKEAAVKVAPIVKDFAVKNAPIVKNAALTATPIVLDPAQKLAKKTIKTITRTDENGNKLLKYDLDKLSELLRKDKITQEKFSFLSTELIQYEKVIIKHAKAFDHFVLDLIKIKGDPDIIIKKYELCLDSWLKKDMQSE